MAILQDFVRVEPDEAEAFGRRRLQHHGLPQEDATIVGQCLDLRGIDTHGLQFSAPVLGARPARLINPRPALLPPRLTATNVLVSSSACAHPRGDENGTLIWHWHHLGASEHALRHGRRLRIASARGRLYRHVFFNASRAMPPWGGRETLLGTNPFAAGAPAGRQQPFLADLAARAAPWPGLRAGVRALAHG